MMRAKYLILLIVLFIFTTITGCANGNLDVSKNDPPQIDISVGDPDTAPVSDNGKETASEPAQENLPGSIGMNGSIVEITGDYVRFDEIKGFGGDYRFLSMIGETDKHIIMQYLPLLYNEKDKPSLMLVDINTLEAVKIIEMDNTVPDSQDNPISHIRMVGEEIIVCFTDHISVMDKALEPVGEIPVPEAVISKSKRETTYDKDGIMEIYFGGYDISNELDKIVYTDEAGIKLYDLKTDTETLLVKNLYNEDYLERYFYRFPRFVANGRKIITDRLGYEYSLGYAIYDLTGNSLQTLDMFSQRGMNSIYYDTGLLEPGANMINEEDGSSEWTNFYLDFETGEVTNIQIEKSIYEHYDFQDNFFVGENYAAFVTCVWDDAGEDSRTENNMYYINRIDLKTLETETDMSAIRGGGPHILGVLTDGRILFRYYYNENENGICMAK